MSGDDYDWADAIEGVTPLKKEEKKPKAKIKLADMTVDDWDNFVSKKKKKKESSTVSKKHQPEQPLVNEYSQKSYTQQPFNIHSNIASKLSGSVASVDGKTLKKLSQGKMAYESKIDLHGFYLDDAWGALTNFINKSYSQELRCVLVVHGKGKGYGAKKDMGIIKSQVSGWLSGNPHILAYHTAIIRHGGNGALYVLLKRNQ
jgi:DNA-nicking Smr family endonuclease